MVRSFSILLGIALLGCSSESLEQASTDSGPVSGPMTLRAPYPEGPYGRGVGATIANLSFLGWRDPRAVEFDPNQLELISLSDFYNPGGNTNDTRLLVFNSSAVWCAVCRAEYSHLNKANIAETYAAKGVRLFGVLFEDIKSEPAKPSDLAVWGVPYDVAFPLAIDPGFKTGAFFESDATPLNMVVDASNMQIIDVTMGYDTADPNSYWRAIDQWLGE